uniref:Ig-like domain-containing protein n=1 Tax=Sarcophilus harrisii TaxID=9305 RepID=A0A7N4NWR6_SARHA
MVPSCHDSSMSIRLLYWVAISLMGMGRIAARVTQIPRHLLTRKNQNVTLRCDPIPSHTALFWYHQTQGRELEFLFYLRNNEMVEEAKLLFLKGYSTKWPKQSFSSLKIHSLEPEDSALLFCASSL